MGMLRAPLRRRHRPTEGPTMNNMPHPIWRIATLVSSVCALAAALLWPLHASYSRTESGARAVAARGPLGPDEVANIDVFKRIGPSVVHITTLATQRELFSANVQQVPRGTGTGFIWDDAG